MNKSQKRKSNSKYSVNADIYQGETIETKVEKMLAGTEKVELTRQPIYTPRNEGVKPEYNIRTDRFAIAQDAMDFASKQYYARREEFYKPTEETEKNPENNQQS